jgi:YfiH family protein
MAKHGIQAVFSDKQGGVSQGAFESLNLGVDLGDKLEHVERNLAILCENTGMPQPHLAKQVHGKQVMLCEGDGQYHQQEADILITTEKHVTVAVRTADCLPILFGDKQAGVAAVAHAGWRGTVAKVAETTLIAMLDKGAQLENILVSLGPCIGSCCFAVADDVGQQLDDACSQNVTVHRGQKIYADLAQANVFQLLNSGVSSRNIELCNHCTSCSTQPSYFSYRRDSGQTGRQLSMISLS